MSKKHITVTIPEEEVGFLVKEERKKNICI